MALTKEEISDLMSAQDLVVRRALDLQNATFALDQARRQLEQIMHGLQYPPKEKDG